MTGWAISGIVTVVALAGGIVWWFCADARRDRARRRLIPVHDTSADTDTDTSDDWSVAAIAARVNRERGNGPHWPTTDPDTARLTDDRDRALSPDESDDRPTTVLELPPQRTAARQRPYIHRSPLPRHPSPRPAVPDLTSTPRLGLPRLSPTDLTLLQRVHEGLKHL